MKIPVEFNRLERAKMPRRHAFFNSYDSNCAHPANDSLFHIQEDKNNTMYKRIPRAL